ncbi:allophanate hydrolase [Subtercola boreus]|uniref:Allophanate hydrolase n=1 Tax=Subtercola boreus TaxID=120213 RepID=A0A3E0WD04_9MICO|nr:allophanate hydrolase [Subtercola boreus]RFA20830.1 allophanate hydrolase [Subtercola boreus]RFA20945.1 allophanate hydrolase [Subtercola boreus]RFA27138.1 allophanate hydrolase [Subtercola boreus]
MTLPTSVDRVTAAYARLRALDRPEIWISIRDEQDALAEAATIDARVAAGESLPLAGTVAGVKDNIDVLGLDTTAAAPSFRYRPGRDATAVRRLRDAGSVVIGKTNLDQFATGLVGARSPFGAVRNAWDPSRISGGSSSGSAVAVALGIVDVALGTDTAGSGRVPAALNGIVGVKLTRGRIPTTGVVPACRSLDCVTVFARELGLARNTAELLTGPDGIDPLARTPDEAAQHAAGSVLPSRPRIGIPTADQLEGLAPGWAEAFRRAAARLGAAGVDVVEVDITALLKAAVLLYDGAFVAERYAAVGAHIDEHRDLIGSDLDPSVAAIVLGGAAKTAVELLHDREELDRLGSVARTALAGCDALLTPTTTWHPTLEQLAADPIGGNSRMGRYTNFANLLDMTSTSIPAGTVDGLPFGVMITAPAFHDLAVHHIAERLLQPAIDILVVGAHLTDQPLNQQLVSAGGTFSRSIRTSADYALFALDTTPPKPGLVRVVTGGTAIAGEVWTLPAAGFGTFVAALPSPMAIGKVMLEDGSAVSGFLCESVATIGTQDISGYGGWLAWLPL